MEIRGMESGRKNVGITGNLLGARKSSETYIAGKARIFGEVLIRELIKTNNFHTISLTIPIIIKIILNHFSVS